MPISIDLERPDTADAIALIDELEAVLSPMYPDESRHGYDVPKTHPHRGQILCPFAWMGFRQAVEGCNSSMMNTANSSACM